MSQNNEVGERLREAACIGDIETLKNLVETQNIDINNVNSTNGWTALHWGAKRSHATVVMYLLDHGADKTIRTLDGLLAESVTNSPDIRQLLGGCEDVPTAQPNLPITPNYLQNPAFPHVLHRASDAPSMTSRSTAVANHCGQGDANEMVLRVRLANADERDFIEVEMDKSKLSYEALLSLLCVELGVDRRLVYKIRKLPDTILRKDKDVKRLTDFQALELVLTNKAMSAASRTYGYTGSPALHNEQILY